MYQNYQKEPKNARALCQTMAWLKAVGVPHKLSEIPGTDLLLVKKDGGDFDFLVVKLAVESEETKPAVECLTVMAKELASTKHQVALAAFHTITEAAGFGKPIPVDRGAEPEKRLSYDDNFELVSMRHREFRRVPNPDAQDLVQYKKVMEQACYRFINLNQDLCRRNCLLVEDLMTYAQVWTCNYLGLYKVAVETVNDNVRKLRAHLKQRFAEFAYMVKKKERNCFPSPDTVQIALLGQTVDENHRLEGFSTDPTLEDNVDPDYSERHVELDLSDEESRRQSAAASLSKHLRILPHEKMVEVLNEAITNTSLCHDARGEAAKQLRMHQKTCVACGGQSTPPQVPDPKPRLQPQLGAGTMDLLEEARQSFRATHPDTHICFTCKNSFPTQVRLINRPRLIQGIDTVPKFLVQSNCSPCRRRSSPKVDESSS